ncbi:MAG TPA: helix-turn-helix transcriptional regulator [Gemmatimonadaceae bacterium]
MAEAVATAADLRALVARSRMARYQLAARIGLHPTTLGMILNERRPLSADVAERVLAALRADVDGATVPSR